MTTHEIISATENPCGGVSLTIRWSNGTTTTQYYGSEAAKALGWKRPDPQPVDPAWMVEVAREVCAQRCERHGLYAAAAEYRSGRADEVEIETIVAALHLALSRGHVVLAPVMPIEDFVSEDDPLFNPIWDVIKGWDIGDRAKYGDYCGATGDHVRSIIRAVRSAAPVMPSEEEMLRDAREDAAQWYARSPNPGLAAEARSGEGDGMHGVQSALQARRNVYASLGAVGKAVSSGPVVPEVDLRSVLTKAWEAGWNSTRAALCQMFYDADKVKSLYEEMRRDDVSAILENLKSGEA